MTKLAKLFTAAAVLGGLAAPAAAAQTPYPYSYPQQQPAYPQPAPSQQVYGNYPPQQGYGQPGRAQQIVEGGQAVDVNLTRPVPVYFVYITAWAERDGDVEFRPDIYGRDGNVDQIAEMDRDPNEPAPTITLAP